MKKHGKPARLCVILLGILVLMFAADSYAIDTIDLDAKGSVNLDVNYDGKPVAGGDIHLYRVAEIEVRDGYHFKAVEALSEYGFDMDNVSDQGLSAKIAAAVKEKALPGEQKVFDEKGHASFGDLELGLYLLVQEKAAEGFEKMDPALVSVPMLEGEHYIYDVDASPKLSVKTVPPTEETPTEETPPETPPTPPDEVPETGQLFWPIPVLAAVGLIFVMIGILILRMKRKRG